MFKNIKLKTVSWFFAILLAAICGIMAVTNLFLERNIALIDTTWQLYQTDRSDKARLESSLRAAIGYGGMIHNFKNYVLRHGAVYHEAIHDDMGAARAVLKQFRALGPTTAETAALEDIERVLGQYDQMLHQATLLIESGRPILEIDRAVKVNDQPAIRGLQTLGHGLEYGDEPHSHLSKGRLVADIRAAIGFGGFIHHFKNYLLRHNTEQLSQAIMHLQDVHLAIEAYRRLPTNRAEQVALEDIANTFSEYGNNLTLINGLVSEGKSIAEIDKRIKVDDQPALRGLHALDREISTQVTERSGDVSNALSTLIQILSLGTWTVVIAMLILAMFTFWLMQARVVKPLLRLTNSMSRLANDDLDVEITLHYRENELGLMAQAVRVFKENMIQRHRAEEKLAAANGEMNAQLENIHKLREQSEAQTTKALNLAEGLASARESAEWAMAHAKEEEEKVSAILNSVRDAIITTTAGGIIETFNPGAEDIFGYRSHEAIGKNVSILMPKEMRERHAMIMKHFADGFATREVNTTVEQIAVRRNGETFPAEITLSTTHLGDELKIMAVMRDITERKKAEEEIHRMAMSDSLTGLANRNQFNSRLKESIAQANRYKQNMVLMLIDLDKFKPVNDTYGHPVGDALLQHVADTMLHCFREVDIVARLGGDEFAVILNGIENTEQVEVPAQRLIKMVSTPVVIEGHTITIGTSIGISSYPSCSTDIDELFRQADQALYRAKESGRNTFRTCQSFATP